MNNCPRAETIQDYGDGELAREQARLVGEHISSCRRCQRLYRELKTVSGILGQRPQPTAPIDLKQKILRAIRDSEPVQPISCPAAQPLICSYLDEELSPEDEQRVESHVFACSQCYRIFKQTQQTTEVLRDAPPVTVPAGLGERVATAVAGVEEWQPGIIGYVTGRLSWRTAGGVLAGAAVAATLIFGLILAPHKSPVYQPSAPTPTVVAQEPAEPLAEETHVATTPSQAREEPQMVQKTSGEKKMAVARASTPALRRRHTAVRPAVPRPRRSSPGLSVAEIPSASVIVTGERTPGELTAVVEPEPSPPALAGVGSTEPQPTVIAALSDITEPPQHPGPELATAPSPTRRPTWTPVRTVHTAVYRGGDQVDTARLSAARDRLDKRIAALKDSQSGGWTVIK